MTFHELEKAAGDDRRINGVTILRVLPNGNIKVLGEYQNVLKLAADIGAVMEDIPGYIELSHITKQDTTMHIIVGLKHVGIEREHATQQLKELVVAHGLDINTTGVEKLLNDYAMLLTPAHLLKDEVDA